MQVWDLGEGPLRWPMGSPRCRPRPRWGCPGRCVAQGVETLGPDRRVLIGPKPQAQDVPAPIWQDGRGGEQGLPLSHQPRPLPRGRSRREIDRFRRTPREMSPDPNRPAALRGPRPDRGRGVDPASAPRAGRRGTGSPAPGPLPVRYRCRVFGDRIAVLDLGQHSFCRLGAHDRDGDVLGRCVAQGVETLGPDRPALIGPKPQAQDVPGLIWQDGRGAIFRAVFDICAYVLIAPGSHGSSGRFRRAVTASIPTGDCGDRARGGLDTLDTMGRLDLALALAGRHAVRVQAEDPGIDLGQA